MNNLFIYWIIISWLINQVFDMVEGAREAISYQNINRREPLAKKPNQWLHGFFLIARTIVGALTVIPLMFLMPSFWPIALYTASLMLSFVFMHDGAYYTTYNILNPLVYKKKWWDQSKTSVAWTDKFMTAPIRTALYILSILCLILCISILKT